LINKIRYYYYHIYLCYAFPYTVTKSSKAHIVFCFLVDCNCAHQEHHSTIMNRKEAAIKAISPRLIVECYNYFLDLKSDLFLYIFCRFNHTYKTHCLKN